MKLTVKEKVKLLEDLVKTCEDGKQGYEDASKDIKDSNLNREFIQFANQRQQFIEDLKEKINSLSPDKNVNESGSFGGLIHRGWMNLKSALGKNDNGAILKEIVTGEESAIKNYEEALHYDLPEEINTLIRMQYSGIVEAHDRIKSLSEYEEEKHDS